MAVSLDQIVTDWGGFEDFVKELNRDGVVTVERNVILIDRNGQKRQIDVLIRHTQGLVEHIVIVECKFWKRRVKRQHVENLAASVSELRADRGIIFTTVGFQSGAVTYAAKTGIELYKVREVTDQEWGAPGRVVPFNQRYISRAISGQFNMQVLSVSGAPAPRLDLGELQFHGKPTRHEMFVGGLSPVTTLEEMLEKNSLEIAGKAISELQLSPASLIFGGKGGDRRIVVESNLVFPQLTVLAAYPAYPIGVFTYRLGIQIQERHLVIDRGNAFTFVFALEDCVRRVVKTASRRPGQENTTLVELRPGQDLLAGHDLWVVWINFFATFDRFEGLDLMKVYDQPVAVPSAPLEQ